MFLTNLILVLILFASFFQMNTVVSLSIATIQTTLLSLFPTMFFSLVLCKLLIQNGLIQRTTKHLPFLRYNTILYGILGILLGFAGNAIIMKEEYEKGNLTKEEIESVTLCFCIPSLSFILALSHSLGSIRYGLLLYFSQVLFAFIALLFSPSSSYTQSHKKATLSSIKDAIQSSGIGIYIMMGYILLVNISVALLTSYLPPTWQTALQYLSEFASACLEIVKLPLSLPQQLLRLSLILGFGSFSAHLQIYGLLPLTPSYLKFLLYRSLQTLFSLLIISLYILKFLS